MAFESLSERLGKAFKNITGKGKLSEKNMNDMLREVRMSLLEADVNYGVVKDFIARVKEKALGTEVMTSLNPGQMVVKIVHDEIVALLGNEEAPINYNCNFNILHKSLLSSTISTVGKDESTGCSFSSSLSLPAEAETDSVSGTLTVSPPI